MELDKFYRLKQILYSYGRAAVAFSGGADSMLLAQAAYDVLGTGTAAFIAHSPLHSRREYNEAVQLAQLIGIRLISVQTHELQDEAFVKHPADRCYLCKKYMLSALRQAASEQGFSILMDGANADDAEADRPGMRAAAEMEVVSPLREAGITKREVREYSRRLGLPTADKPSMTCLATRLPIGTPLTRSALSRIESAEDFLAERGLKYARVRDQVGSARIELHGDDRKKIFDYAQEVASFFNAIGFAHTTVDLLGYREGSMAPKPPDGGLEAKDMADGLPQKQGGSNMAEKLSDLPNISKVNEQKLIQAGITTPDELRKLGSKEAIRRVRQAADPGACCMMLYALEGAIRGVRSKELPEAVKQELKAFHKTL